MKHRTIIIAVILFLAGCGGSKELEKSKPAGESGSGNYEKTFRPSDYDMDVKAFLAEVNKENYPKPLPGDPPKADPLVLASGFRVQLLATEDVDEANAKKAEAESAYAGEWFYVIFDPPTYKLRSGNFLDRGAAGTYAKILQDSGYPDAWVVPEKVYRNILPRPISAPPNELGPKQ